MDSTDTCLFVFSFFIFHVTLFCRGFNFRKMQSKFVRVTPILYERFVFRISFLRFFSLLFFVVCFSVLCSLFWCFDVFCFAIVCSVLLSKWKCVESVLLLCVVLLKKYGWHVSLVILFYECKIENTANLFQSFSLYFFNFS